MSTRSCLVCGTPATKSCSSCKSASYCNEEHQKKDWRAHKGYCLKVKAAGSNTFDAILFPATESKPRLVKVPWELIRGEDEYEVDYHKPDLSTWFKHPNSAPKRYYFDQVGFDGPELGRALCFFFDDNFFMNDLPTNRCIVDVTGGKAGHQWCGDVVGLRMKNLGDYGLFDSVDMEEDLKVFAKYFENYGAE